ncbi:hypothetical protein BX600DRAFT_437105 [Xylariales sp. PMI_506]|nr:hypothetical protein BX600DRAFT_437105 [Xylariales sp. PMI_506]
MGGSGPVPGPGPGSLQKESSKLKLLTGLRIMDLPILPYKDRAHLSNRSSLGVHTLISPTATQLGYLWYHSVPALALSGSSAITLHPRKKCSGFAPNGSKITHPPLAPPPLRILRSSRRNLDPSVYVVSMTLLHGCNHHYHHTILPAMPRRCVSLPVHFQGPPASVIKKTKFHTTVAKRSVCHFSALVKWVLLDSKGNVIPVHRRDGVDQSCRKNNREKFSVPSWTAAIWCVPSFIGLPHVDLSLDIFNSISYLV